MTIFRTDILKLLIETFAPPFILFFLCTYWLTSSKISKLRTNETKKVFYFQTIKLTQSFFLFVFFILISISLHNRTDNHWYAYVFISCVAIGCYVNGLNGAFVHDDIPAITLNKDVIGTNKITRAFFNDFWGTPMDDTNSHKSYRPLTVLSFR